MKIPSVAEVQAAILGRGWVVHRQPYRLNIVILRKTPGTLDKFDDMLFVFWYDDTGKVHTFACRCTADPGRPSREHPKRRDGTAVWAECQLVDGFALGMKGTGPGAYRCYRPIVPVPVLRYTSVDDTTGTPSTSDLTLIHRASADHESTVVGPWSEGCTVVPNPLDFTQVVILGDTQVTRTGHTRFSVACMAWPAGG